MKSQVLCIHSFHQNFVCHPLAMQSKMLPVNMQFFMVEDLI